MGWDINITLLAPNGKISKALSMAESSWEQYADHDDVMKSKQAHIIDYECLTRFFFSSYWFIKQLPQ